MDCYRQTIIHRDLFVPSFPLEKSLCILNLTVPSSFASGVVVLDVVSCIATTHSSSVGGVSGGYTHCSSANNPHCLMSDSNPAPECYIFYITSVGATGIDIERFTA